MRKFALAAAAAAIVVAAPALAIVTFDSATGTGFVGKGDVQLALVMNNAQVQTATVEFTHQTTSSAETTWTCDKDNGPQTQERNNTVTSEVKGIVSALARDKKQAVTGYILGGFVGLPTTSIISEDGPRVGSCPTGWSAIDIITKTTPGTGGGLFVNGVALQP